MNPVLRLFSYRISLLTPRAHVKCGFPLRNTTRSLAQTPQNSSKPSADNKPGPTPTQHSDSDTLNVRHEVHEGTSAVNIPAPFNPPGSGGGVGIGSVFPFTSSPLFDAALTTIVGLGLGKSFIDIGPF